jgi:hypothetical protein
MPDDAVVSAKTGATAFIPLVELPQCLMKTTRNTSPLSLIAVVKAGVLPVAPRGRVQTARQVRCLNRAFTDSPNFYSQEPGTSIPYRLALTYLIVRISYRNGHHMRQLILRLRVQRLERPERIVMVRF